MTSVCVRAALLVGLLSSLARADDAEGEMMRWRVESERRSKIAGSVSAAELCSWKDPYYLRLRWEKRSPTGDLAAAPEPLRSVLEAEQFIRETNAESLSWVIKQWGARRTVVNSLERVGEKELARLARRGFALSSTQDKEERNANDKAFRTAASQQLFLKYFVQSCPKLVAAVDHR